MELPLGVQQRPWSRLVMLCCALSDPAGHVCAVGPGLGVRAHLYLLRGEYTPRTQDTCIQALVAIGGAGVQILVFFWGVVGGGLCIQETVGHSWRFPTQLCGLDISKLRPGHVIGTTMATHCVAWGEDTMRAWGWMELGVSALAYAPALGAVFSTQGP